MGFITHLIAGAPHCSYLYVELPESNIMNFAKTCRRPLHWDGKTCDFPMFPVGVLDPSHQKM